mmetsp:Transcript_19216/g.36805  ORF Transcript_19216/g.36805 Transcript_19216/m.36805 type:complete len:307 (-) Transcript_19216:78-998(-)
MLYAMNHCGYSSSVGSFSSSFASLNRVRNSTMRRWHCTLLRPGTADAIRSHRSAVSFPNSLKARTSDNSWTLVHPSVSFPLLPSAPTCALAPSRTLASLLRSVAALRSERNRSYASPLGLSLSPSFTMRATSAAVRPGSMSATLLHLSHEPLGILISAFFSVSFSCSVQAPPLATLLSLPSGAPASFLRSSTSLARCSCTCSARPTATLASSAFDFPAFFLFVFGAGPSALSSSSTRSRFRAPLDFAPFPRRCALSFCRRWSRRNNLMFPGIHSSHATISSFFSSVMLFHMAGVQPSLLRSTWRVM